MTGSGRPRVVDFTAQLAGPLTSQILAQLGADVIKVEHWRRGDGNRDVPPMLRGVGLLHVALNAGIRSLGADPRADYWPELVAGCCRWADVVIVGSFGEDARKRGLDFATMRGHNEKVVYCDVLGYGATGPWSGSMAHGPQMEAYAGSLPVEWSDGEPRFVRGYRPVGPTAAAMYAALGIYAGLYQRDLYGQAIKVDVSVWAAALAWQWRDVAALANTGHGWVDYEDVGCRYGLYRSADGRVLLLCPGDQASWERFCDVIDLAGRRDVGDWSKGVDWGEGEAYAGERAAIQERIGGRPLSEWIDLLGAAGVPFAPVLTLEEAMSSEHAGANRVLGSTSVLGEVARFARVPINLGTTDSYDVPELLLSEPPRIGEHTEGILEEVGLLHLKDQLPGGPG